MDPIHPRQLLAAEFHREHARTFARRNAVVADWITHHVLASLLMFDGAIILPLVCLLPGMHALYTVTVVLSSNWIQLWALPALQRSQNQIQLLAEAKIEADHQNIVYLVNLVENIEVKKCNHESC